MKIEKKLDYIGTLDVGGVVKGMFDIDSDIEIDDFYGYNLESKFGWC